MNYTLISQILGGSWFLDRNYAENSGLLVKQIIEGNTSITSQGQNPFISLVSAAKANSVKTIRYSKWSGFENAKHGSVAIIKVHDVLMQQDQPCGPVGMDTIGNAIKEADTNDNIVGLVLDFRTPGGSVMGLEVLGDTIKNTTKPIIGFISGMACSAGMWLASCCDERIVSSAHDMVGSIGTMSQLVDFTEAYEKMGIKIKTMYSHYSGDKNKLYHDVFKNKEGEENYINKTLDPLALRFQEEIKTNLPNITDDLITGKAYFAKDVIGSLVDKIGTIEDAILLASGQPKNIETEDTTTSDDNNESTSETTINPNSIEMKNFDAVNTVLGIEALESVDGTVALNEEQIEAINTALTAGTKAQSDLTAEQTVHKETNTQLTQAKEQIVNLKKAPGAESNELNKSADGAASGEGMEFLAQEDIEQFKSL